MRHVLLAVACGLFASGTASAKVFAPGASDAHASASLDASDGLDIDVLWSPGTLIDETVLSRADLSVSTNRADIFRSGVLANSLSVAWPTVALQKPFGIGQVAQQFPPSVVDQGAWWAIAPQTGARDDQDLIGAWRPIRMEMVAIDATTASIITGTTGEPDPATAQADGSLSPSDNGDVIVVTAGEFHHAPGDPFERINAVSFAITEEVDKAVLGPVARAYDGIVPRPIRRGIRNFLNNLREPVVFVNYLLQLKPGKAAETIGRFAINTTLGLGGVVDVAKRCPFNLPWRPNGFGDTLGVYGVKEGPYIFLPLLGPTTIRDMLGGVVDRLASPIALGGPFKSKPYLIGTNIYRVLDRRAEMEDELQAARESEDPYAARRDQYFAKRKARVARLKGEIPDVSSDPETGATDPAGLADAPAPAPAPAGGRRSRCAPVGAPDRASAH